jgi:hypothetical protein
LPSITKPTALTGVGMVLLLTVAVSALARDSSVGVPPEPRPGLAVGHPLTVTGAVTGQVRPGSPATLRVTIGNESNQDIAVTRVTGIITGVIATGRPGVPACSAAWFSVGAFSGHLVIRKKGSGAVALPVAVSDLPGTNQDGCRGAVVGFSFTALAERA